jgi:chemotaxis protein MotB
MSDQSAPPEIVIVRRRGGDEEEGHHGGVWKIAYADFMTAMMAFFLVMWLVNASDKKVLTQVASYFNPLKMSDRVTAAKGIEDMIEGGEKKSKPKSEEAETKAKKPEKKDETPAKEGAAEVPKEHEEKPTKKAPGGLTDLSEQELFNDPYGILEKLAASVVGGKQGQAEKAENLQIDNSLGKAFRDPFDPDFNRVGLGDEPKQLNSDLKQNQAQNAAKDKIRKEDKSAAPTVVNPAEEKMKGEETTFKESKDAAARALQSKLEKELAYLGPGQRPSISTTVTPEGILISLTDEFDFEMFRVASAQPNPKLVAAMKKVGEVLRATDGSIVVRGHTDGRPFKKGTSDNWVLSSQRALMSRYMLINGGVPEKRIAKIEGYADTMPKSTADPLAAQNRRIEVLLRKAEGP